ncbi:MAG: asparaginase [Bdellovibrionales bacterium]|nr:asparaginase [Bdellovibrionales bacterium]
MSHAPHPIRLIVTGGTFDKEYDEIGGRLFFKDTHVAEMLRLGRATIDIKLQTLMMIDSLDMTDADRSKILDCVTACKEEHIVITHGTDTMATTARTLGQANLGKTIVLTGAMVPYKFGSSDGLFNLGASLAFAQTLPHGVYVAMNGRSLPWNNVTKNKVTGEFGPL